MRSGSLCTHISANKPVLGGVINIDEQKRTIEPVNQGHREMDTQTALLLIAALDRMVDRLWELAGEKLH